MGQKQDGFTLVEMIIALAIIFIAASFVYTGVTTIKGKYAPSESNAKENYDSSYFDNNPKKSCVGGFYFAVGPSSSTQILDEKGHGIPCGERVNK